MAVHFNVLMYNTLLTYVLRCVVVSQFVPKTLKINRLNSSGNYTHRM